MILVRSLTFLCKYSCILIIFKPTTKVVINLINMVYNSYRILGGYRALLATLVLISHTSMWLPSWVGPLALGNVGVLSFFVLSGFVIAEACDVFYPGAPLRFLINRFLRIFPTYWAACLVAIIVYNIYPHSDFNSNAYAIFANFSIVLAERLPSDELRLISVIWAVGIELRFYVAIAILDYIDRFASSIRIVRPGQILFTAGVIFQLVYFYTWSTDFSHFVVMRHAPFFVLGFTYYRWLRYRQKATFWFVILGLLISIHSYSAYNSPYGWSISTLYTTLAFVLSLTLFAGLSRISKFSRTWERLDKRLGELTYALYLVHWPIVYAIDSSGVDGYLAFSLTFFISVIITILLILGVERPLFRWRDSIRRTRLYW